MANRIKYSGLCETCDHDQSCMLKRIPQLEIIECEQFCTHTIVGNVSADSTDLSQAIPAETGQAEE